VSTRRVLSQIERRAVWEAHGKSCAYCRGILEYSELEIDHIVPISIERNASAMAEYGIDHSFNFDDFQNFAPSCRICNSRKAAHAIGRASIELKIAQRVQPNIHARIKQLEKESLADNARFNFSQALRTGIISEADVNLALSEGRPATTVATPVGSLTHALTQLQVGDVSDADYDRILNMRVDLPPIALGGLTLTCPTSSVEVQVTTISQYLTHIRENYYPKSSFDIYVASGLFDAPFRILSILRNSKFPDRSFIRKPHRGVADLNLLPASLLHHGLFEYDELYKKDESALHEVPISALVGHGEATIRGVSSEALVVETVSSTSILKEVLRTDVDGDGVEELVILRAGGPLDGSHRFAEVVVLKRSDHDAMFTQLPLR
jgi:HNH endonuclease